MSYFDERKKALGLQSDESDSGFFEKRKAALGLIEKPVQYVQPFPENKQREIRSEMPEVFNPMKQQEAIADRFSTVAQRQQSAMDSPLTKAITGARDFLTDFTAPVRNLLPEPKSDTAGQRLIKDIGVFRSNVQRAQADNPIGAFIGGAGDAATLGLTSYAERMLGNPEVADRFTESSAGRAGQIAGSIVLPAGKIKAGVSILSNIGRGALAGGILGAGIEAGEAATGRNNQTLGQRALDIGINAGLGGAGVGVIEGIGKGLQAARGVAEDAVSNQLQAVRAIDNASRSVTTGPLRVENNTERLSRLMGEIRPIVTERMVPPLENPRELARWLQPHLGDVSLNEINRLSYDDLLELADEVQRTSRVADMARQVARERGQDLDSLLDQTAPTFGEAAERMRMGGVAGVYRPPANVRVAVSPGSSSPVSHGPIRTNGVSRVSEPDVINEGVLPSVSPEQPLAISQPPDQTPSNWKPPEPLNQDDIPFNLSDDLDDIDLPAADEVAPRIRDRLNTFADDMITNARAELAKGVNRLSSTPVDVWGQYAKLGAGYMLKGTVKLADFTERIVKDLGEEIRPHVRRIFKDSKEQFKAIQRDIETQDLGLQGFEAQELKDLTNINLNTADVYRNFKTVFGKHFDPIKKAVLDPFDDAKGAYASEQKQMTDDLYKDIVQGLGIKKGSKESELVQKYGEGQIDLASLQDATDDWEKIVEADQWFRAKYDDLLDRVNTSISRIYPNNPDKLVPKRSDYYRHFQDLKGWSGIVNLFDAASGKISAQLSGQSPWTKPKSKWASFKQQRGLGEFKNDAVGGFLEYIPAASYAIHIDPQISTFRNLAKRLASDTEQTGNINNFIEFLNNYANDLSGKTSMADRWVQFVGGRNTLRAATWLNNRVKTNMILGNLRSTLAQLANVPSGIAYGGVDAGPGAIKTLQSVFQPNEAMQQSRFMTERFIDGNFRRFRDAWWEQPKKFAEATMELSDRIGTSFIWNTAYAKGLRQKVADPIRFADEQTRRLVGGRGVGEQPLLLKSQVFNILAPFQLEVNNLWRVMKDFVDAKQFGSLLALFISNYALNKGIEAATGSGVTIDPIDAIIDSLKEDDISILQRIGRVGGEVLSNVPLGSMIADIYPEYGTKLFGAELPSRKELFGDNDPTRFGTGLAGVVATDGITDPLFKLFPPFGGAQLKKTIQGADALARGGSYSENILTTGPTIESPELKYPVSSKPADAFRALAFGPFATSGGQRYVQDDLRKLSEDQTKKFERSDDGQSYYDGVMKLRDKEAEKRKKKEEAKKRKESR